MLHHIVSRYYMAITLLCVCYTLLKGVLVEFKFWYIEQNLIPYVWQMVFANVSIQ